MRRAAGFHDDQRDIVVGEPALKLRAGQPVLLEHFPLVIDEGDLEYTFGQINRNGSSMHSGPLSLKTDPDSRE
jgi:hypothetical protein